MVIVLLHPPLLGPAVWRPVAAELAAHQVAVPDLRPALDPPEFWPARAAALATAAFSATVRESAAAAGGAGGLVVAHSGAGVLVPLVVEQVGAAAAVFVDAILPARPTSDRLRGFLAGLPLTDGHLPRWSDWWGPEEMAELIPDAGLRAEIEAEQLGLPLAFYDQAVPVPASWPPPRVGYLQLSPAYAPQAAEAAGHGWPARVRSGGHLDLATHPAEIAALILDLADA